MSGEVLQQKPVGHQVRIQSSRVAQGPQVTPEHEPVKARQNSLDLILVLCDKLVHGASPSFDGWFRKLRLIFADEAPLSAVCESVKSA
jgi:hypothetical protein